LIDVKRSLSLLLACLAAHGSSSIVVSAADAQLSVDLARPGPAISPFIYSQFIEHLGRCIHDGIWAEKLRDRKFLLDLANKSPWEIVRPAGAVFDALPDTAGAYCGDRCLALWLRDARGAKCGLRQNNLGLIAGKEYVGYAILAQVGASKPPVEIRLAWGDRPDEGQSIILGDVGLAYRKIPFRFHAGATTESASLSVLLSQPAYLWLANLSLMPADSVRGLRADTLALIHELNAPLYRWPGGNFVSGYDWKDGIGDRDRRPPRWERAWNDVEDNDFGADEFMAFCAEVGAEPYIAVNTGLGSVEAAADEVEYFTGSAKTRWGAERARNGHPKPYAVTWWGVGNEMFGDWQLGSVPVERYALRHNAFVTAMKARNPHIKIIAVGAPGKWNDVMLPLCAANMDLLSGHHYTERKLRVPFSAEDAKTYQQNFAGYSGEVAAGVRRIVTDFRDRLGQGDAELKRVRLAIDEWGIVRDWNPTPDAGGIGPFEHYYTLGDMIAAGRAMNELLRSADLVQMANWAQTVNVIAAIKTSRNYAVMDPVGHLLALYRAELRGRLAPAQLDGNLPVDAVAAWDNQTGRLGLALINYSTDQEAVLPIRLNGVSPAPAVIAWRIDGPSLAAINQPGQPESVATVQLSDNVALDRPVKLPPHSILVLRAENVRRK
jgi:alpha-N-arabinofuranosidase